MPCWESLMEQLPSSRTIVYERKHSKLIISWISRRYLTFTLLKKKGKPLCVNKQQKLIHQDKTYLKFSNLYVSTLNFRAQNTAVEASESNICIEPLPCMPGALLGRRWAYRVYFSTAYLIPKGCQYWRNHF